MKNITKKIKLVATSGILCLAVSALSTSAFSYTFHPIRDGVWALECGNGAMFSYSGGEDGFDIVGSALCDGHGGITKKKPVGPAYKSASGMGAEHGSSASIKPKRQRPGSFSGLRSGGRFFR